MVCDGIVIHVRNFKSIGPDKLELAFTRPITVIVGKNNTGKSALVDLVQILSASPGHPLPHGHRDSEPEIAFSSVVTRDLVDSVFPANTMEGGIPGSTHHEFGLSLVGRPVTWQFAPSTGLSVETDPPLHPAARASYGRAMVNALGNPLAGVHIARVAADRDIRDEGDGSPALGANGQGATNLIQSFLNHVDLPADLVGGPFLETLNEICGPDMKFSELRARRHHSNVWEIFLGEEGKGLIPLSHSGSGIKTIILVLCHVLLVPVLSRHPLDRTVLAFEELENNLHPSLLRRLLSWIRSVVQDRGARLLLTTHSPVTIDVFARDPLAGIVHVRHDGRQARSSSVQTYIEHRGVLDDLDVRASDVLQANGIVWVEGPSDRVYMNRWLEIVSDGKIQEGVHYQCMFFGGRLLAALSAEVPDVAPEDALKLLTINRNAAIVMDSDLDGAGGALGTTKVRIIDEVARAGGLSWVTGGRTIENYIPTDVINALYGTRGAGPLGQFDDIEDYLEKIRPGEGRRFRRSKVGFSERIVTALSNEHIEGVLDLRDRVGDLLERIRGWNGKKLA
ncbi:MAG TPA: AAA family ATPase [Candidatus Eisenbacteria bacterium]|nr:AAA family ATPase [Candidatus Eisenbacteria bacterium]